MVRVGAWREVALLALCQLLSTPSAASVSVIERDIEPTLFETSVAVTSDSTPVWLVVPMLLDVQPVLMKVDVTRHVPAQVQSFCREHGVDATRCAGAIREALDEVMNFQRFCKQSTAEKALPGFVVAKNVLRSDGESAAASWLQNDPEDVALDFCAFARSKVGGADGTSVGTCAESLGTALRLSFDWMLALTPCDQLKAASREVDLHDTESPSLVERLATIEQMISELQIASLEEGEVTSVIQAEPAFDGSNDLIGEITEVEESAVPSDTNEIATSTSITTGASNDNEIIHELYEVVEGTHLSDGDLVDVAESTANSDTSDVDDANSGTKDEVFEAAEIANFQCLDREASEIALGAGNGSCEAATLEDEEDLAKDLGSQKTWKVGVALVLALSIMYLAIDLTLQWVNHVAGYLGKQKQLINVLLHDVLLLASGGSRSTLTDSYAISAEDDDLKKPAKIQSTTFTAAGECSDVQTPQQQSKEPNTKASSVSCLTKAEPPKNSSSPLSFACVAMMLMAAPHAPISHDQLSLTQEIFERRASTFMHINEIANNREQIAVQRIQRVWKASQRSRQQRTIPHEHGAVKSKSTPLFQLLQLRSKKAATQAPRANRVSSGFHRLVPSALPPL